MAIQSIMWHAGVKYAFKVFFSAKHTVQSLHWKGKTNSLWMFHKFFSIKGFHVYFLILETWQTIFRFQNSRQTSCNIYLAKTPMKSEEWGIQLLAQFTLSAWSTHP